MTPRITLIKSYRNKETLRLLELREVAELISQGEYDTEVSTFRRDLPTMRYAHVSNNGTLEGYENWPKDLPRIWIPSSLIQRSARMSRSANVWPPIWASRSILPEATAQKTSAHS